MHIAHRDKEVAVAVSGGWTTGASKITNPKDEGARKEMRDRADKKIAPVFEPLPAEDTADRVERRQVKNGDDVSRCDYFTMRKQS